ncbi:MAG: DUF1318 domain-containing protein [Thermodesulfobacteriota bacterium]|nr:DUF1318 domain-containing protein [Thermodesulfobacteriota bacterium]
MKQYCFFGMLLLLLQGCTLAEVRVNVVSERTALENQVLGSYNALSEDVLLLASVRGVDPLGRIQSPPRMSRERQDVIEAIQTLAFHADDVDSFKRLVWVGENNEGLLTTFPMEKANAPEDLKDFTARYQEDEFKTVVHEVNAAREVVMGRVVETNENFTKADLPKIRQVFGKINRENSLPGEKIQMNDGTWIIKSKSKGAHSGGK